MAARRDAKRGVYMISVAAELAGMHPQTLRIYESRGLIEPERTSGGTRRYSDEDVERLRRIQELTNELGMNLAGVERVFELEEQLDKMRERMARMERQAERLQQEMAAEIEKVRKSFRAELVPYQEPGHALIPARDARGPRVRIPIERQQRRRDGGPRPSAG
jgi:MerR family transcriptional regulator, heat shock protein HspR